jgi:RNA polymerase sigma factor (sigma-70 family)
LRPQSGFDKEFETLFEDSFPRLFRYMDRLSGDPDLASDLAQEAFVKLYRRGSFPDSPDAWLATVATNLFRNNRNMRTRRRRLLTPVRGAAAHSDDAPGPSTEVEAKESSERVRRALDRMEEPARQLLLLRAEGYSYKDLAAVLEVAETSVGTMLARAREAFKRQMTDAT